MTTIFVYGTLKRGGRSRFMLKGAEFLREAITLPQFALFHNGTYPCMVSGSSAVSGELWRVDSKMLAELDHFEGVHTGWYRRESITLADGSAAYAYIFQQPVDNLQPCAAWPLSEVPA